ncbi:MAG: type II toxin-antitoxin system VapC family toxin [Candidatus Aminicenantaceae bacterium]
MKRIVIDASVVLKWFLADEKLSQPALALLDKYVSFELEIVAPSLLEYEVLNGLHIARKRGRIPQDNTIMAVEGFLGLEIEKKDISSFYPRIMHFSETYNLTVYDASYLAVADEEGIELVTADKNLCNRVKKALKWSKWLGDI